MRIFRVFLLEIVLSQPDPACQAPQKVCNGIKDCFLGEDEMNCPIQSSTGEENCVNLFRCDNKCLDNSKVCDGNQDCTNGMDETLCYFYSNPEFWMTESEGPCGQDPKCSNPLTCDDSCDLVGFYRCYDARQNQVDDSFCASAGPNYVNKKCSSCVVTEPGNLATGNQENETGENEENGSSTRFLSFLIFASIVILQ
ncbi:Oidioi.mRNA.OKI2018_I69.PAR.g9503.t1.cds [Oikopleura dioica]|uniref:Oidioi.mRNA.OKI2018_I69.PAR.g9503.t1.cds n=1 Tax=Oikopleura dioica TaxID=34765 RepID=A0ABN7RL00_OIKDI|nr:Oidioi.mRNA.OKI2018_I69.PAR.g9503.t1.cds [Oikopleura dioica]